MKTLAKWILKHVITPEVVKTAIHAANAELAKASLDERKAKVMDVANDVAETAAGYCAAFADGEMSAQELAAVDAQCDKVVDKYITDGLIAGVLDAVMK